MMKRIFIFTTLVFTIQCVFGQKSHIEIQLHSLKAYYDARAKEFSKGDTMKLEPCREKTIQFVASMKKYLFKIDSIEKVIQTLNEAASGHYYILNMGKRTNFDWSDCNTIIQPDGSKASYWGGCGANEIDCIMKIEKVERSRINTGFTTGQTFYREDIK